LNWGEAPEVIDGAGLGTEVLSGGAGSKRMRIRVKRNNVVYKNKLLLSGRDLYCMRVRH